MSKKEDLLKELEDLKKGNKEKDELDKIKKDIAAEKEKKNKNSIWKKISNNFEVG